MNYARFFNTASLAQKFILPTLSKTETLALNLGDIFPNSRIFPFKEIQFTLKDGSRLDLNEELTRTALQNCPNAGNPELLRWLYDFQKHIHDPPLFKKPSSEPKICLTSGSMEGLGKTFEMLVEEGDEVFVESPTYTGVLSALQPLGCKVVCVQTDHLGLLPTALADLLQKHSPKFLYTVPNGANPSGATSTPERMQQIYQLARKHDLLILEDDPYYFVQFQQPRSSSYLSMDEDGRVMRFDSFSKVLSSGIRLGFVTGARQLVDQLVSRMSTSSVHASHLSQMMVLQLLKKWGIDGFERHVQTVVDFYASQKEAMMRAADKHLTGLAEWSEPRAGMFLWMRLLGVSDSQRLIEEKAQEKKVLLVPGRAFLPDGAPPSPFARASFSLCDEAQFDEGFRRLASLIREEVTETDTQPHGQGQPQ